LGVTLFDRTTKQIKLTDAGVVVLAQAQRIVKSLENLTTELADVMNVKKGSLRIGLPPMVGASFFPQIITEFHSHYPGITLQLLEDGGQTIEHDVLEGSLDLGVVVLPVDQEHFDFFPFANEDLMLVVHVGHPFATRSEVELAELQSEPFVFFREDFTLHHHIRAACSRAGFQPHVVCESSQWDFIGEMVAAKLGIALLPATIVREFDSTRIRSIPLASPSIPWHLGVIWRKDKYLSFAARKWMDLTRSLFTNDLTFR
ncbi:MAG: LysR substrate-binding domain-containing protein, partial [Tumebacillaceae bacterium]